MGTKRPIKNRKKKMAGPLRVGIALIILGAFIVGLGGFFNREAMSIYGFIVVVCGFVLYFTSHFYLSHVEKNNSKGKKT
jgi:hypothetical protein